MYMRGSQWLKERRQSLFRIIPPFNPRYVSMNFEWLVGNHKHKKVFDGESGFSGGRLW